jgi:RNA polymerase sigma-70 factor (ECF subfamily)
MRRGDMQAVEESQWAELTIYAAMGEIAPGRAAAASPMVELSYKRAHRSMSGARAADADATTLDSVMERCANGDEAAFGELYRRGAPRVRGFLLRLCGDRPLADDLTQEAFLRVYVARGNFEAGAAVLPWIFAIARNVYLDFARHSRVRRAAWGDAGATSTLAEPQAAPETRGDEALAGREMLAIVRATLARMPILLREAFVLIRFEGMSVHEAAQVLGSTEGAVKVRAFRAYELLREALEASAEGGK